jgi:hypothetical protein
MKKPFPSYMGSRLFFTDSANVLSGLHYTWMASQVWHRSLWRVFYL